MEDKKVVSTILDTAIQKDKELPSIENSFYLYVKQNKGLNEIAKMIQTQENTIVDRLSEKSKTTSNNILMTLPSKAMRKVKTKDGWVEKPLVFNGFTQKLYNLILSAFNQNGNNPQIIISIDYIMKLCVLRDKKETRKNIAEALDIMKLAEFSLIGEKKKNTQDDFFDITILGSKGIVNGNVVCSLTNEITLIAKNAPIMPLPKEIFSLSDRKNPNSFNFYRYITEHKQMNIGKPNENKIAVKTLLKHSTIPSYETVKATDRHYSKRIIEPFERDMNALNGIEWVYLKKGGAYLTDKELENMAYSIFIDCTIGIQWKDYPREVVEKAKLKATTKKKKTTKK